MTRTTKTWMAGREALYEGVGKRLRDHRLDAGLILTDVQDRTGIWTSQLSQVERGLAMPKLHELALLARLYGTSIDALVADLPL